MDCLRKAVFLNLNKDNEGINGIYRVTNNKFEVVYHKGLKCFNVHKKVDQLGRDLLYNNLRNSQVLPCQPSEQTQENVLPLSLHVPLFLHGFTLPQCDNSETNMTQVYRRII